jgi:hypothetical protein
LLARYARLARTHKDLQVRNGDTDGKIAVAAISGAGYYNAGTVFEITGVATPLSAPAAAPEPASLTLAGVGIVGLLGFTRRRYRYAVSGMTQGVREGDGVPAVVNRFATNRAGQVFKTTG